MRHVSLTVSLLSTQTSYKPLALNSLPLDTSRVSEASPVAVLSTCVSDDFSWGCVDASATWTHWPNPLARLQDMCAFTVQGGPRPGPRERCEARDAAFMMGGCCRQVHTGSFVCCVASPSQRSVYQVTCRGTDASSANPAALTRFTPH